MYIVTSTYGGMDWHDSRTIYEQLKGSGSYDIREDKVPEAIADDIAKDFPYVEDIREKVLQALSEKSNFHFMIKSGEKDSLGNVSYKESACYEDDGRIYYEAEADFDGEKQTLTRNLAFGQVSYITTYHVEDIPDGQLGYIVTEDFLAPAKGVDLVERLYHDIFDELEAAQDYADNLKLHGFKYPTSIVTFLVCNKESVLQTEWYKQQKEAMQLMEEKGQTYLDDSFHIFARRHIENLKKLSTKECLMKNQKQTIKCSECNHCSGLRRPGNTSTSFTCSHPDQGYIQNYFREKRMNKMPGFLGYGARYSEAVPIKTAPAWCPEKKTAKQKRNGQCPL